MQLTEKTKADDANLMYPNQRRFHPIPAVKFFTAIIPTTQTIKLTNLSNLPKTAFSTICTLFALTKKCGGAEALPHYTKTTLPIFADVSLDVGVKLLVLVLELVGVGAGILLFGVAQIHTVVIHKFRLTHKLVHCRFTFHCLHRLFVVRTVLRLVFGSYFRGCLHDS